MFLRPSIRLSKYGNWSVITGSTDGIGKETAIELARKGQNIVLISRTQEKLNEVEAEIKNIYIDIKVKTIQADFSNFDIETQKRVMDILQALDIGILINNVGMSYPHAEYLEFLSVEKLEAICNINCTSMVILTRLLLPQLLKKKNSCVINVSSAGGFIPHQLYSVYAASKAFVTNFTKNMELEHGSNGVIFQTQVPFLVVSKMSKVRQTSLTVPSAKKYAYYAVSQIGYSGTISPHPVHSIMFSLLCLTPWFISSLFIDRRHKSIRKRAYRKKAMKTG
jgi:17beta-estradiol 17-dehydrogenase / very-long-chain 3-oxoacyl-CoA reductase